MSEKLRQQKLFLNSVTTTHEITATIEGQKWLATLPRDIQIKTLEVSSSPSGLYSVLIPASWNPSVNSGLPTTAISIHVTSEYVCLQHFS